jgi:hypothetical protein
MHSQKPTFIYILKNLLELMNLQQNGEYILCGSILHSIVSKGFFFLFNFVVKLVFIDKKIWLNLAIGKI